MNEHPTASDVSAFSIAISDSVLSDLRERLARTRWPDDAPGSAWQYGTDLAYLRELCGYWHDHYDWRVHEARLNAFAQFTTDIEVDGVSQNLHFLHVRSPHPNALPLIITHGWPGSVYEFHKIIGPLVDPADPADAFHVVCPSMPGYGFSGPTTATGWDCSRIARANAVLMARLGYDRYGAQGGDWGAIVTTWTGAQDPDHCAGVHVNMVVGGPPDSAHPMAGVTAQEAPDVVAMAAFRDHETGYQGIQGTKPQTLAYGLTDSPAGLAGWIVEKFRTWSDCDGDIESRFTKDQLLTNIMIYWVTGTINSSTRLYYETIGPGRRKEMPKVNVPAGCALFPKELYRSPRVWAENTYTNITRWSRFESGGHFAALEEPEVLVDDVRAFFATVR